MEDETRKDKQEKRAKQRMFTAYLDAVDYVAKVVKGKIDPDKDKLKAAFFAIEQEKGRARQQVELSGNVDKPIRVIEIEHHGADDK